MKAFYLTIFNPIKKVHKHRKNINFCKKTRIKCFTKCRTCQNINRYKIIFYPIRKIPTAHAVYIDFMPKPIEHFRYNTQKFLHNIAISCTR